MARVTVKVPATTANIGPGFDCLGAALTLYNQVQFTILESSSSESEAEVIIKVRGEEARGLSRDKNNLLYQSFVKLYQYLGQTPPSVAIDINLAVPLARGLGSSATAIVGGLVAGNYLAGNPLSLTEIMQLAITIEGHPDNVVPALIGNCQLSIGKNGTWQICEIPWHSEIIPVLAIPDFELSTEAARKVLPTEYSRADAIFNVAHIGLLIRGLETNQSDWLKIAMEDQIHQPYRKTLIPGYEAVKAAAISAGAYGMVISGAGPSLLALTNINQADAVVLAMQTAWQRENIKANVHALAIDTEGAVIF